MFEFLTGRVELISTYSPEVFARTTDLLNSERIRYSFKTTYTGSRDRNMGTLVSLGNNLEFETQYQIFVKKQDYEKAIHVINR